jgi:hypothetical protein
VFQAGSEAAGNHFGLFALFASMDAPASSALTRKQLGLGAYPSRAHPGPGEGHYFAVSRGNDNGWARVTTDRSDHMF